MTKKKKVLKIFVITLITMIFIGLIGISVFTGLAVFKGTTELTTWEQTIKNDESYLKSISFDMTAFQDTYNIEQITINSTQSSHIIPASSIHTNLPKSKGTAILVHGLGGAKTSTYPIAKIFLELGYDVLAYDQRRAGDNKASLNTLGYLESYDLLDCVNYVRRQNQDGKLIVWGCSYGGATAGIALGRDDRQIDAAVLDCPLSDGEYFIKKELEEISNETGLPPAFMLFTGNVVAKIKLGFSFHDTAVPAFIGNATTPVLIFNSKADTLTPSFMGQDIYAAISHDRKKIITVDDSKHISIFVDYPTMYRTQIEEFLSTI